MRPKQLALTKLVVLACLLGLAAPIAASATTFWGCLMCRYGTRLTFANDTCEQVGHNQEGYTACTEESLGLDQFCSEGGSPCFNVDVDGGSGGWGGGGGGGGNSCTIVGGGVCPASCSNEASPQTDEL
jgi:hypothetical protein